MAARQSVCSELISSYTTITFLNIQAMEKYFSTIHGKAVTRYNAKNIKDHSTPIYNHTIQKQNNTSVTQTGKEKILAQRWINKETFILFQMKEMINTTYTLLQVIKKLHLLNFHLL